MTRDNKFWLRIPLKNDDEISKELKDDAFCGISFFDNLILWNPNYNGQKSSSFFLYYHGNWNRAWKRGFDKYMIQNKIPVKLPEKLLKLIQLLPFSQMSRECSQIEGHKLAQYELKNKLVFLLQTIKLLKLKLENNTIEDMKNNLVDLGYSTELAQKLLDLYDYLEENNITKEDETFKDAQYYYFNQNVTFSNNEKQDAFINNMSEEDDILNSVENLNYFNKTEDAETSEEVVASVKKCIDNNNDKIATAVLMNILSPYVAHIKFEALQNFISLDQKTYHKLQ